MASRLPAGLIVHPDNVLNIQEIFGEESAKQSYVNIMNSYVDSKFLAYVPVFCAQVHYFGLWNEGKKIKNDRIHYFFHSHSLL